MLNNLKQKYKDKFYRNYLWYTALETELLFFIVCDVMFLTKVKNILPDKISLLVFLSLVFSLIIQYPLLKWINKMGNRFAVRIGSIIFMLSAIFITFSPNFLGVLFGGFLKCVGHTLNSIGTAILKNKLSKDNLEEQYVSYQSDANSFTSFVTMCTSLICGGLFYFDAYLPMLACIAFSIFGVFISFIITKEDYNSKNTDTTNNMQYFTKDYAHKANYFSILIFISFAIVTSLSGIGLSYARINFQEVLTNYNAEFIVSLLGIISAIVYLIRIFSNLIMKKIYEKIRNRSAFIFSKLLIIGLFLQILPWIHNIHNCKIICCILLCSGYLLLSFVRDPFITLVQNICLENSNNKIEQQNALVLLNASKKTGALLLSAICTLLLNRWNVVNVIVLMTIIAMINYIILKYDRIWDNK